MKERIWIAAPVALSTLLALVSCAAKPPQERPLPASTATTAAPAAAGADDAPGPKAAIGDFGVDLSTRNLAVKPGDDFFSYANGGWYDRFTIPADKSSFGPFDRLDEISKERVRSIIEQAAAAHAPAGTPQQQIGDYYAAYMDEAAIEAHGLAPAQADLQRIAAARTHEQIAHLFGEPGFATLFDVQLPADFKNPDRYCIFVSESTLGLPDRDYYLKDDPALKELRGRYVDYIAQMLTLGGIDNAAAKARDVMAFETEASKVQWPVEKRRDVDAIYNPRSKSQLRAYAPGFPWQPFLEAQQLGAREQLVVGELTAVRDLSALFGRTSVATLRDFLTFHYLSSHAPYLPRRFDEARFAFYGQAMHGQPQQRERWKRAVDAVDDALGEAVGRIYVAEYFPPESKAKMQQLVTDLEAALSERIDALDWMTPQTKTRAHEKLAAFTPKIGYPDKWKDYSQLTVRRDDLLGNVRRAAEWQWNYQVERLDKPVDRGEWQMTPQEINAYYNPSNNEIVFPAAILQPPLFDPNADAAVNFGAIGAVIGHEMGHGFDDQGRKFGPDGAMRDWWTPQDAQVFTTRTGRLIKQFSAFEALPGLNVNGANTIGENIGDLGGLNVAHEAYRISLKGQPAPVLDGLSGDQRFFLGYAQVWREKYREGAMREMVLSNEHSPPKFRVNGPLPNIDDWYRAFDVQPGDKLYLKPEDRVRIW
ncbi:MAG: M13 family metallopeptidase [Gammaproteobacteria bacterium]|nr:M13 family metallopeptidase [Gammaproteobacteria bacterium]MBV8306660.1 M13 family metallopeptidase [Gammaproteobacteria bacterium]